MGIQNKSKEEIMGYYNTKHTHFLQKFHKVFDGTTIPEIVSIQNLGCTKETITNIYELLIAVSEFLLDHIENLNAKKARGGDNDLGKATTSFEKFSITNKDENDNPDKNEESSSSSFQNLFSSNAKKSYSKYQDLPDEMGENVFGHITSKDFFSNKFFVCQVFIKHGMNLVNKKMKINIDSQYMFIKAKFHAVPWYSKIVNAVTHLIMEKNTIGYFTAEELDRFKNLLIMCNNLDRLTFDITLYSIGGNLESFSNLISYASANLTSLELMYYYRDPFFFTNNKDSIKEICKRIFEAHKTVKNITFNRFNNDDQEMQAFNRNPIETSTRPRSQ